MFLHQDGVFLHKGRVLYTKTECFTPGESVIHKDRVLDTGRECYTPVRRYQLRMIRDGDERRMIILSYRGYSLQVEGQVREVEGH